MTKKDIDNIISIMCPNDEDFEKPIISPAYLKNELEALALEQEPCDNAIDRSKAIKVASGYCHPANVAKELAKLPSVNPQPKTGYWINIDDAVSEKIGHWIGDAIQGEIDAQIIRVFTCSECGAISIFRVLNGNIVNGDLCPNCRAKMSEIPTD